MQTMALNINDEQHRTAISAGTQEDDLLAFGLPQAEMMLCSTPIARKRNIKIVGLVSADHHWIVRNFYLLVCRAICFNRVHVLHYDTLDATAQP